MFKRRTLVPALALSALALTPGAASAAAGDLDTTFGTAGKRVLPGAEMPLRVFAQPDGKIVTVGGQNSLFGFRGFIVRRVLADGRMDPSFDKDGTATASFSNLGVEITPVGAVMQPDGKIVVAGGANTAGTAVARFTADGALDKSFDEGGADGDGRAVINTSVQGFGVNDVVVQPSGKIGLAGTQGNDSDFAILRLRSDGSPDGTTYDLADFADNHDNAKVAVQSPDGTTTVVGTTQPSGGATSTGVARYRSDGKLDTSLAGTGKASFQGIESPEKAALQPDGKLLIAGINGSDRRTTVITRLTREGVVDTTFGTAGFVNIDDEGREALPGEIIVQPDGRIVATGSLGGTAENATFDVYVARYDSGGQPDPSFGSGGRVNVPFGEISVGGPAAVQPDGNIVISAYTISGSILPRPVLARLHGATAPAAGGDPGPQQQPQTQQPQDGGQQVAADTVAPKISSLRVVRVGKGRRRRLELRFKLSEAARVQIAVQRLPRKGRAKAVPGSFSVAGKADATRIDITRRSIVRKLASGRYRLVATPTDAAGNRGTAGRASFTVAAR